MILRIFAGSLVALGCGLFVETARADQSFVCDNGELVQVKRGDLERMKRENACVASHYGLSLHVVPLPVQRPKRAVSRPAPRAEKMSATAEAVKLPSRKPVVSHEIKDVALPPAAYTDYRRVRIINAQPDGRQWFTHKR